MSPPTSPAKAAGSRVSFSIKVKGAAINTAWQVVSVDTWTHVNRVPKAQVVLYDGSPSKSTFAISSLDTFLPGNTLEIAAAYDDQAKVPIFAGVIVKQGIEIGETGASRLVVDVTDPAMRMTLDRKSAVFTKFKDSSLIGKLIGDNGLKAKVTDTGVTLPEIVQYYASDWDLMLTRAEMNGFVVVTDGGTVTVGPPDTSATPALAVKYGESVLDLRAEMDASTQLASSAIKSFTWDPAQQKVLESGPGSVQVKEPGNVPSDELARVFGIKRYMQQTGGPIEPASLKEWSSAELLKSRLSKIRGWVRFQGSSKVKTGGTLELQGLGTRFNGTVWVSGVHHSISQGRWLTTVDFGLSAKWFASEPGIEAPDASGQLPAVQGLQTGIVKKVGKDPGGEFRVQVNLPLVGDAKNALVWARLSTLYAGSKVGAFFYPEPGDEVIVGFMNDDPRFAVILGAVYSKKLAPPVTPEDANDIKALVTRGKLELRFNDKDKVLEIRTPKHTVKLDDKTGEVRVEDGNRNRLVMSKSGVTIESASNLTLTAKGNITLDAKGNLSLKAAATAALEGAMVNAKAKVKMAVGSGGLSELTASGLVKVQGALVKIN
jgi:Rhs element Vgr protein